MASSDSHPNRSAELNWLFAKQKGLLDRLVVYQKNLDKLLVQKAKVGIDVPLRLSNGIEEQEQAIQTTQRELDDLQGKISALPPALPTEQDPQKNRLGARFTIAGVEYDVVAPYPFIGLDSVITPDGLMKTTAHFAGGFDVVSATQPGHQDLVLSFFRHGRRISPILDEGQRKLILPLGASILVPGLVSNWAKRDDTENITPQRVAEGCWTIISPGLPQSTEMVVEWPQEHKGYVTTSHIAFEGGFEVWVTQPPQGTPISVWFYIGDWLVAPMVNESLLALAFPSTPVTQDSINGVQHQEKTG